MKQAPALKQMFPRGSLFIKIIPRGTTRKKYRSAPDRVISAAQTDFLLCFVMFHVE